MSAPNIHIPSRSISALPTPSGFISHHCLLTSIHPNPYPSLTQPSFSCLCSFAHAFLLIFKIHIHNCAWLNSYLCETLQHLCPQSPLQTASDVLPVIQSIHPMQCYNYDLHFSGLPALGSKLGHCAGGFVSTHCGVASKWITASPLTISGSLQGALQVFFTLKRHRETVSCPCRSWESWPYPHETTQHLHHDLPEPLTRHNVLHPHHTQAHSGFCYHENPSPPTPQLSPPHVTFYHGALAVLPRMVIFTETTLSNYTCPILLKSDIDL